MSNGEMTAHEHVKRCPAVGALQIGGVEKAAFQCELDEGHGVLGIRHSYVLEWADDTVLMLPDVELFDPDETFDLSVPFSDRLDDLDPRL